MAQTYQKPYNNTQSTRTDLAPADPYLLEKQQCSAKGGRWDSSTNSCIMPEGSLPLPSGPLIQNQQQTQSQPATTDRSTKFNADKTVTVTGADGKPVTLSPQDYQSYLNAQKPMGGSATLTSPVVEALQQPNQAQVQGQQLASQVGQAPQLPISPTGLDIGEAATQGIVGAIPRALSLAAAGAGAAALAGGAAGSIVPGAGTAIGAGAGAIIGGIGGFLSGITSGIIGNFKTQRTDTKQAQKRVLIEGKTNLRDWATLAQADPANKALYLSQYNQQVARIDQAYRQMKLDTSRDLARFEDAVPELAEFEAFYSTGGEKQTLDFEMRNALVVPSTPEYKMLELSQRRNNGV